MPSPRSQSVEKLDEVSLPFGSEKVVSVKRRSKHGNAKIQPLSINTGDGRTVSTSEGDLSMRKVIRREKKRYSGIYEDPKTHRMSLYNSSRKLGESRKSHALSSIVFEPNSDRRRVISCLELNAPVPAELDSVPVEEMPNGNTDAPVSVPVYQDTRINHGTFVFPRDPSKLKTPRERDVYVPFNVDDSDTNRVRYSGIFLPESSKRRSTSRHHLRKSRSSNVYPSPATPMWSPFVPVAMNVCSNCMTPTCQRCHAAIVSPRKSYSQDVMGGGMYPYETADVRGSQYMDMPPVPPYPQPQHRHTQQHSRQRMSNYYSGSRMSDIDRIYHMPSRTNLFNTSIEELNGYGYENDKMVDLLEIEYTSPNEESGATQLSPRKLNLIVSMARDSAGSTDDLESMARQLKLSLDQHLGEKWHVVIGTDSFGSNLASLPGALANFKVDKYVFLVWQT